MTNPPSYQKELDNLKKYKNVEQGDLPVSWTASDRFVRSNYFLQHLPAPRNNDANTGYGFMYSALASSLMPAGLPVPKEDRKLTKELISKLTDPNETYGSATYFQSISDLTNKQYRFKSLIAPSDVYFDFKGYDFSKGQPVQIIKRIDEYAQQGWSGDVKDHLVKIKDDIYAQDIE